MSNKDSVFCNGCGYTGGPSGDDWEVTTSPYSWGRCPKCKTTNLEVTSFCSCGTKMEHGIYGVNCLKCNPATKG